MRSPRTLPAHLIEIIVVDDGSADDTWRYLSELQGMRSNLKIFQQPHAEVPAQVAIAVCPTTGAYVFFHDADDYFGPTRCGHQPGAATRL